MSAIIIDFATHAVKHQKYDNSYIDELDDFDDFDAWDEQLSLNKTALAATCFEATYWIPTC